MQPICLARIVLAAVLALLPWTPTRADWLATTDGRTIETDGPWEQRGRLVCDFAPTLLELHLPGWKEDRDERSSETGWSHEADQRVGADDPDVRRILEQFPRRLRKID